MSAHLVLLLSLLSEPAPTWRVLEPQPELGRMFAVELTVRPEALEQPLSLPDGLVLHRTERTGNNSTKLFLTAFIDGEVLLPPLRMTQGGQTEPLRLNILPAAPPGATEVVQVTSPLPVRTVRWTWLSGVALSLLVLGGGLVARGLRDRKGATGAALATEETAPSVGEVLAQIEALRDGREESAQERYSEMAAVVRAFIGGWAGVGAGQLTTAECLGHLQRPELGVSDTAEEFLRAADLVRFADADVSEEALARQARRATDLVRALGGDA